MFKPERNSIRTKLFTSISLVILISLALIYSLGFFNTKNEIQEVLDANMAKSAKLVLALIYHELEEGEEDGFLNDFEDKINARILHEYEKQIHIQVWREGELVYVSDHKLSFDRPKKEGFEDLIRNGEDWRRFTLSDEESEVTIAILEKYQIRSELLWRIFASPFIPLGISSLMILLIWFFIDKKIGSLNILSKKIAQTSPNKLEPFNDLNPPLEIKPLVDSLNSLIVRLAESMQLERRFTDYAAHELRTPLAVIKTHVQLMIKDKKKAQDDEYLRDLERAVERMIHLVSQVLILVRLEPDNLDIEKEKLSLSELINGEIENFKEVILEKKITLNIHFQSQGFYLGSKTYLEIMLRNLLDNALKYSLANGEVKIDLSVRGKKTSLKISNFGDFVAEDQRQKIFDVFYRVNSGNINGSGLGLAIVKKIAELHGAKIHFNSSKFDEKKSLNEIEVVF
jgi:two-component system sensor histidine kinase QseC